MGFRSNTTRRRAVVLVLAYLLALQGMIVAWTAATVFAAEITGVPAAICTSQAEPGSPSGSNGLPSCCPCGAFCLSGGGVALGRSQDRTVVLVRQPITTAVICGPPTFHSPPRFAGAPAQARAPPA